MKLSVTQNWKAFMIICTRSQGVYRAWKLDRFTFWGFGAQDLGSTRLRLQGLRLGDLLIFRDEGVDLRACSSEHGS